MKPRNSLRLRASVAACLSTIALGGFLPAVASAHYDTTPAPPTTKGAPHPYYSSCDQVRAAGKAPLLAGQPGYTGFLDPKGTGVACGY
ncbi:excalibur calcium-binding domain-containing protein [Nocardia sp.]|uniref:excalibur calcium-binding domain-containing protein n=1 Tax=Nocardia sp. TaxID=1821 RepID=UPI00260ABD4F|nr:excalibur calcium-binding domain-containing protein [Nocardia sp.]